MNNVHFKDDILCETIMRCVHESILPSESLDRMGLHVVFGPKVENSPTLVPS